MFDRSYCRRQRQLANSFLDAFSIKRMRTWQIAIGRALTTPRMKVEDQRSATRSKSAFKQLRAEQTILAPIAVRAATIGIIDRHAWRRQSSHVPVVLFRSCYLLRQATAPLNSTAKAGAVIFWRLEHQPWLFRSCLSLSSPRPVFLPRLYLSA
jgi:hypothetical protein